MTNVVKPPRTPWGVFPEVLIHASESAVKQHPAYSAAKVGDDDAAIALVLGTFNMERALEMSVLRLIPNPRWSAHTRLSVKV